jgi:Resolvase, N terminal domain
MSPYKNSELRQVAERGGWSVVEIYRDAGISGAKGRDKRPGLDAMLNDASRRRFDVVMAWAIDRLGRSLIDLLGTIGHLEAVGVDLYLEQQNLDTTTPTGKLLFQITGPFCAVSYVQAASWPPPRRPRRHHLHGHPITASVVVQSQVAGHRQHQCFAFPCGSGIGLLMNALSSSSDQSANSLMLSTCLT